MKRHKELVAFLKAKGLRMTPSKEQLIQFFLDNQGRFIPIKEIQEHLISTIPDVDRTTIYRNIEKFIRLGLIQELDLPAKGKVYQYAFGKKMQHNFICKCCGKLNKGNEDLFKKIEKALKDIEDFSKANLSLMFYGFCAKCEANSARQVEI